MLASTLGRLYASAYYALRDTRTPLYYAVVRIGIGTGLGYLCAIPLPPALGIEARWGVAGLTFASSLAGWVELALLRGTLNRRIGRTKVRAALVLKLWGAAVVGGGIAWGVKLVLGPLHPIFIAMLTFIPYGLAYWGLTICWKVPESQAAFRWLARILRSAIRL